ncbi:[citrate (pro-3S)-lyase] ligase [Klebsiella grimontii]|mgnify:FL=1|uniref:[citrate (pro-3S)-lyase] ligase n=1 Tax=Klebsiella grimontii TaxID=2058152 RepID=UPI00193A9D18|nr:[citrate (pro-3S)-lyase] ligase [Klebsiella grimontii]MBW5983198.1 [citrate (pro-3S)-lyase] ligase [Klebsiella michiganensis]MBM1113768.1 [citrate (pro-3S)-lyase] ligase [Klebsiella grimontii]MBZ6689517.1 [citrate (pro-3S)-lyase] ligase [Klebsiella grimontii]MBZ7344755.1 [citrate (pro-3S)-lyase] ligase [Klebsiella grimontii]MBZ7465303.1 [citrate (pro-3S)-lyase] ligase [Klebsiella grimontii]
MNLIIKRVTVQKDPRRREAVDLFLHQHQLSLEADCERVIVAEDQRRIVGCGAIAGCVLKCIAVDPSLQGEGLSLKLLTELMTLAYELGRSELFLFTKPDNAALFSSAGFWPIARAGDQAVLMENSRERLARYCRQLTMYRQPGEKIGAIVMNANPFTLGHRWLVEQAARQCDWLHLFVVKEDASFFSYQDRVALIEQGIAGIANVTLHPGSAYLISRATFPGYFLKDKGVVDDCHCQIDLQLFREHLAPALQITHRFVGSEPLCSLTRNYNLRMKELLEAPDETPAIQVVELERVEKDGAPISASRVRKLYKERQWSAIAPLVPPGTLSFLMHLAESEHQTA